MPHTPPASMHTFATPRRPAPPRRKKDIPKPTNALPTPSQEEGVVPEADVPLSDSISNTLADAPGEKVEVLLHVNSEPVPIVEFCPPSKDEALVPTEDSSIIVKSSDHTDVPQDARTPSPPKVDLLPPFNEKLAGVFGGRTKIEERPGMNKYELDLKEPLAALLGEVPAKPRKQLEEEGGTTEHAAIAVGVVDSGSLGTISPFERTLRKGQEPPVEECVSSVKDSVSAVETKEIIGQRVSLKERVAALQGEGGLGSAKPPPKPTTEKPNWKPPKPVRPPSLSEKKVPVDFETIIHSPPPNIESTKILPESPAKSEEHQRRAAIAARLQRMGGARIGMGPPVIAPKPLIRQPGVTEEETKPSMYFVQSLNGILLRINGTKVTSLAPITEDLLKETGKPRPEGTPSNCPWSHVVNEILGQKDSVDEPARSSLTSHKPPTSMPILVAPRRAAPPRPKKTLKLSAEPPMEGIKTVPPPGTNLKHVPAVKPYPQVKEKSLEPVKDSSLVDSVERFSPQTLVNSGDHGDVPEDICAPPPLKEDWLVPLFSEEKVTTIIEEQPKETRENSGINHLDQGLEKPLAEILKNEAPTKFDTAMERRDEANVLAAEPVITEGKSEEQPEEDTFSQGASLHTWKGSDGSQSEGMLPNYPYQQLLNLHSEHISTPSINSKGEEAEIISNLNSKPTHTTELSPPTTGDSPGLAKNSSLSISPSPIKSSDHANIQEDTHASLPQEGYQPAHSVDIEKLLPGVQKEKPEVFIAKPGNSEPNKAGLLQQRTEEDQPSDTLKQMKGQFQAQSLIVFLMCRNVLLIVYFISFR